MKTYPLCLLTMLLFIYCGNNKNKHFSNGPEALNSRYKNLSLPFSAYDSTVEELAADTMIPLETFKQYVPDTIFNSVFNKKRKFKLYPVGKIEQGKTESYFLTLANEEDLSALYISVFDSGKHIVSMPLIVDSEDAPESSNSCNIDKKLSVSVNKDWVINNVPYYRRIIYAYNNVGVFTTVLTETNEQRRTEQNMINPLDTFPKKNKYSGDYSKGKSNKLFIRDGIKQGEYLFYIHFQKNVDDNACNGEVRGIFKMVSDIEGKYTKPGDPCELTFTFKGRHAVVKENGSCGNYRDIKCFFDDTYEKLKEPKAAPTRKK